MTSGFDKLVEEILDKAEAGEVREGWIRGELVRLHREAWDDGYERGRDDERAHGGPRDDGLVESDLAPHEEPVPAYREGARLHGEGSLKGGDVVFRVGEGKRGPHGSVRFLGPHGDEVFVIDPDGQFVVKGEVVAEDRLAYEGFRAWLGMAVGYMQDLERTRRALLEGDFVKKILDEKRELKRKNDDVGRRIHALERADARRRDEVRTLRALLAGAPGLGGRADPGDRLPRPQQVRPEGSPQVRPPAQDREGGAT